MVLGLLAGLAGAGALLAVKDATTPKDNSGFKGDEGKGYADTENLTMRVSKYITQGGRPEYQNATEHPSTMSTYNEPYAKKNGKEYGTFEFYQASDGTYTRDLAKATDISLDPTSGKITVNVPDKWADDEVIKNITNNYTLQVLSKNYKNDHNVLYQDPYDETKKVNTEKYVEMMNEAAKDRTTLLEAMAPTKANVISYFGGSEKRNKVINDMSAEDIIIMSSAGQKEGSPLAVPKWLEMAYPEITELSSYSNGFVKPENFRNEFYNIEKGKITESQADAITKTVRRMLSEDVEDMTPEEYARTLAMYQYLSGHDPVRSGWQQFLSAGDAAAKSFYSSYYNNMYDWVATGADILANAANLSVIHGNSVDVYDTMMEENDFGNALEDLSQRTRDVSVRTNFNALSAQDAAAIQANVLAKATQVVATMAGFTYLSNAATNAVISHGSNKIASDMAKSGAASASSEVATAGQTAAANHAAGQALNKALAKASSSTMTQHFFNLTGQQLKYAFEVAVGGSEAVLNGMSVAQIAKTVSAAVKVATAAKWANTAVNALSMITLSATMNNPELTRKVMSSKATSAEAKLWLKQTAYDTAKMAALSYATNVGTQALGKAYKGSKIEATLNTAKQAASRKMTDISSKVFNPWLKFRNWWLGRKMAAGSQVSNATVTSAEAVREAELVNVARANIAKQPVVPPDQMSDTIANMSTPPLNVSMEAVGTAAQMLGKTAGDLTKMGVVVNGATGTITPYEEGQAALSELENQLTDWEDIDTNISITMGYITNPDIEPVISVQIKENMDADTKLLDLENKAGLTNKAINKANKKVLKDDYSAAYTLHSPEVAVYAARSQEYQIIVNEELSRGVDIAKSEAVKGAKARLQTSGEKLPLEIRKVIDEEYIPTLRVVEHSLMSRMAYDWHVYPEKLLEGLRSDGKWGTDGGDWLRMVARKDMTEGTYTPFDKMAQRDNVISLNRFKVLEDDEITWLGNGLSELIREASIANAERKFVQAAIKATGLTPEVAVSGEKTAAARSLKEYRAELNAELRNGVTSLAEDLSMVDEPVSKKPYTKKPEAVKAPKRSEAQQEIVTTGGIETAPIDELRVIMKDNGVATTDSVVDQQSLTAFYEQSSPQARKLMARFFEDETYKFLSAEDYLNQIAERNFQTIMDNGGDDFTITKDDLARYPIIEKLVKEKKIGVWRETDNKVKVKESFGEYEDNEYKMFFDLDDFGQHNYVDFAVNQDAELSYQDRKDIAELVNRANERYDHDLITLEDELVLSPDQATLGDTTVSTKLSYEKYNDFVVGGEANGDYEYTSLLADIDRANALASDKVKASGEVEALTEQYAELQTELNKDVLAGEEYVYSVKQTSKKGKKATWLKYELNEDKILETIDDSINDMVEFVRGNKKANLAVEGIMDLQGVAHSPTRYEFIVLENILSKEGKTLFDKTIKQTAKAVVDNNIPKTTAIVKGNLDTLYKKVENTIRKALEVRLGNARAALESAGETVDSTTVTELLDKYNREITEAKTDSVVIKTTNDKGETEYLKVSPTISNIYNNRPVYTPMSKPMQIMANLALLKRISTTNLNPRSFAKQSMSDPAMAFASVGALPGTFNMLGDEVAFRFGDDILEFFEKNDPTRYENIRIIAERDGISLAEAAVKNSEAIGNTQLPFSTINQEALRQANASKYGNDKAIQMRKKSLAEKTNKALNTVSAKIGKANDKREEYVRKVAGQTAYRNALDKGYNPEQAETFRRWAIDNATTNFRRKHSVFNNLRTTTPYLTSGISGAKSFWSAFILDPVGVSARIFSGFVAPIMYFMGEIMSDEDLKKQYQALPEYKKRNHIIIAVNGSLIRIPIGEELGKIVSPLTHIVEAMHGQSQYSFWNLMLNDFVGFVPVDLTGFTDPDLWENITGETPSFLEVMDNGVSQVLSQTMPPVVQSVYMAATGKDLYTGKRVDTGYVTLDEDGNPVIMSYSQSEFAQTLAKQVGGDANVIEKVTSGIFGTTALHVLDSITSAVQYVGSGGKGGSLTTAVDKAVEDISKPFDATGYNGLEQRFLSELGRIQAQKREIEHGDPRKNAYIKLNDEISKETDPKRRQELINKRNGLLTDYYNRLERLVKGYRSKGGTLDSYQLSLVTTALTFEDAVRADRAFMHLNTDRYDAKNEAIQTLYDMGITNPEGPSALGYIYYDKNGEAQLKVYTPTQVRLVTNAINEQGNIQAANLEAIIDSGNEDSIKELRKREIEQEQPYWDKYNKTGSLSSKEWDAIDEMRKDFNKKAMAAILPYIESYGPEYILSDNEVLNYLDDHVFRVPSSYEKVKGRYISSGGGKLDKQTGFAESYIKTLAGVRSEEKEKQ